MANLFESIEAVESLVPSTGLWQKLSQLNALARVHTHTPAHVLTLIEGRAESLAQQIADGKLDMQSSEVMRIGEEIVAECDIGDLQLLGNLIMEELSVLVTAISEVEGSATEGGAGGALSSALMTMVLASKS